jgi:hypothetical protein
MRVVGKAQGKRQRPFPAGSARVRFPQQPGPVLKRKISQQQQKWGGERIVEAAGDTCDGW